MPRISVVVPVYNVEPFLAACLDSLARQTYEDLEVVMVEDGSTDRSPEIAEQYAARDPRFRLIRQPNGGLGKARNTGTDAATGEFLAFVDSDDVLADNAYQLLIEALGETGSDFATGNVHRLSPRGTFQSPFLADTFTRTRLKTHVTEFRPLLADRTAWNKLWRRSFWDAHGYRFPEGVLNEDIPVVLPAHFAARSVDVIADPIYYWRLREGGSLSITQRRLEMRALHDRMNAVEQVSTYLAGAGQRKLKRWYDESVFEDDLRYYVNVLDGATEEYKADFLDRVNAFLDDAHEGIFDRLPAIERLKWHLVRRRLMPELLEVLRFQREELIDTPPVEIGGRWYGDYPFRVDERLKIPLSVYLLEGELYLNVRVEDLEVDGDELTVRGLTWINGIGADSPERQRVSAVLLRPGRLERVRVRATAVRGTTAAIRRDDATAEAPQRLNDLTWAGFEAVFDLRKLRRGSSWRSGEWRLYVTVEAGKVRRRRRTRFLENPARPVRAVDVLEGATQNVKAGPAGVGGIAVDVTERWGTVTGGELVKPGVLELRGELHLPADAEPKLEVASGADGDARRYKVDVDRSASPPAFKVRVPVGQLRAVEHASEGGSDEATDEDEEVVDEEAGEAGGDDPDEDVWQVKLVEGAHRHPVRLRSGEEELTWSSARGDVSLYRSRHGNAALAARDARPRLTAAHWQEDALLELTGELPAGPQARELVFVRRDGREGPSVELSAADTGFAARFRPTRIASLGGDLPLAAGTWELHLRSAPGSPTAPVMVRHALYPELPLRSVAGKRALALGMTRDERAILVVDRDLADDERGAYNQRRLRTTAYAAGRSEPLREAVVYSSFSGRQYSDNPRAIHEELVRRGAPLEHLWVVRDEMAQVPSSATAIREGGREFHEALAQSRFVVANDHFPPWFARRDDQRCIQTWHGTPLKRLGLDVSEMRQMARRFERNWEQQVLNWQYVVSPNRFTTPILRRAYSIEGEMLETGYPRNDVLAADGRDARSRELRRRLGIADGVRTVLYAPTYRDQARDRRGRYRLDLRLDLDRLHEALGPETVLLFRKHHYVSDPVPHGPDGFVRDVSDYPDGTELMLAADVLLTDYSSMMFDFANTGRPMLFFTYDLDAYKDEIRGFYFDFAERAPGPLLPDTDGVAEALRDLDAVQSQYADRYREFAASFCEFDDGRAAARVVDRVFGEAAGIDSASRTA